MIAAITAVSRQTAIKKEGGSKRGDERSTAFRDKAGGYAWATRDMIVDACHSRIEEMSNAQLLRIIRRGLFRRRPLGDGSW